MNPIMYVLNVFFNPNLIIVAIALALFVCFLEWHYSRGFFDSSKSDLFLLSRAIHASEDGLVSGGVGQYYFDIDRIDTTYDRLMTVSKLYFDMVEKYKKNGQIDFLGFVEKDSGPVGAISLLALLVLETKLSAIIIRLRKRMTNSKIIGLNSDQNLIQKKILLITDVITTGRTVNDAVEAVTKNKGTVIGICALFDRRGKPQLPIQGIPVSICTTEEELRKLNLLPI